MAKELQKLASDTVYYGLSTILGRFLNWALVFLHVRVLAGTAEYGVVTNVYAWTALFAVILTYGMETGFFRFINKKEEKEPMKVYSTTLISIASTSLLFILLAFSFLTPISQSMGYGEHPEYIGMMVLILGVDAFTAIPFAYLRYQQRPIRFAVIKLINIFLNISLNIFFLVICPEIYKGNPSVIDWFYRPDFGAGYIFLANAIASVFTVLLLLPQLTGFKYRIDTALLKRMLRYSFPILILGIAGIFNQVADKILLRYLFEDQAYADRQLGIYGACFKIAVVMMMFIQAFRYAYEPFIFARNKEANDKEAYARVMKYFIIFTLLIFLGVMFYLDIIKHLITPDYYEGLKVVPIVMLGEMFFGIYFNLSLWYKLTDQTRWGAYFSITGCVVTVLIILLFAPTYGYIACAWASFASNLLIMLLSYFIGQRKFPVAYDLRSAFRYFVIVGVLYAVGMYLPLPAAWMSFLFRTILLVVFIIYIIRKDIPLDQIPIIGNLLRMLK